MAPNTNLKAVALFGVSPKDLELIVGTSNAKQNNARSGSCDGQEREVKILSSNSKTADATASSSFSTKAELIVTPAPSFDDHYLVKGTAQGRQTLTNALTTDGNALQKKLAVAHSSSESAIKNEQIDSDRYWEDVADSDTLWHYHSVTALRMDARRDALARVLKRLDNKKIFEQEASSLSLFGANAIVKSLQDDAKKQNKKHQSQALSKDGQDETNHGYWDELDNTENEFKHSRGRVAPPNVEDSNIYWTMETKCDNNDKDEDEEDVIINSQKQETALTRERRHAATLRIQEEIRLLSRLSEFRQHHKQDDNNELFSVNHMIELEQQSSRCGNNNVTVMGGVPVGHYEVNGADYWDW